MTDLLKLIQDDAADVSDRTSKTSLDDWIYLTKTEVPDAGAQLKVVLSQLSGDWKQWRAFRHAVRQLKIKGGILTDAIAKLTEDGRPEDPRARFYAYLARIDLGTGAAMDELLDDVTLRHARPMDWLQLAHSEVGADELHANYLRLADHLHANEFAFVLSRLRSKYADEFANNLGELCLAMPFEEAHQLAALIDDEYHCGISSTVEKRHRALKNLPPEINAQPIVIFREFDEDFKRRLAR